MRCVGDLGVLGRCLHCLLPPPKFCLCPILKRHPSMFSACQSAPAPVCSATANLEPGQTRSLDLCAHPCTAGQPILFVSPLLFSILSFSLPPPSPNFNFERDGSQFAVRSSDGNVASWDRGICREPDSAIETKGTPLFGPPVQTQLTTVSVGHRPPALVLIPASSPRQTEWTTGPCIDSFALVAGHRIFTFRSLFC
jgi:hypothetical protein